MFCRVFLYKKSRLDKVGFYFPGSLVPGVNVFYLLGPCSYYRMRHAWSWALGRGRRTATVNKFSNSWKFWDRLEFWFFLLRCSFCLIFFVPWCCRSVAGPAVGLFDFTGRRDSMMCWCRQFWYCPFTVSNGSLGRARSGCYSYFLFLGGCCRRRGITF